MIGKCRVVDYIIDELAAGGVDYVFGVDGANIEDLFDAMSLHPRITGILAKHEFSAATMADGYRRVSSGLGVVAATSGGGSLNLVAGLGESYASRVPVLALVGQPPTTLDGRGSFQDTSGAGGSLDAVALFSAVSVYCRRVTDPNDVFAALPAAIAAANAGGPAVLLLPKDVQQSVIERGGRPVATPKSVVNPQVADLTPIIEELRRADGPITIIAGEQVARDDARAELERLRAALGASIATVPDAKDVGNVPGSDASSALGVTGVMGHPGVERAMADSAVCLVVGTRLSATARAGLEPALGRVSVLSIGSAEPYLPALHVPCHDLVAALAELTRALPPLATSQPKWVPDELSCNELRPPRHDGSGIGYRAAMVALDEALPDGADVVVDAGNTGAAAIHYLPVRGSGRFVVALGMGGMGYSFGAGIGMAFARPHRRTVVIAGDGSFFMHGMELHTAIEYDLPLTVVLFNNNAHAMCVTREQLFYGGQYSYNRFRPSRLGAGLAAMFPGLASVDVRDVGDLPDAMRTALAADGPSVVSIECAADEIPPFAPFLGNAVAKTQGLNNHPMTKENPSDVVARA
jgi:acetolactate synthase I/II/III large subunit